MGQLLSQPITEKNITFVQHDHISHSIGEMQGYRLSMEDAYCDLNDTIAIEVHGTHWIDEVRQYEAAHRRAVLATMAPPSIEDESHPDYLVRRIKVNIYGVFDGHGGSGTSRYMAEHLPPVLLRQLQCQMRALSDEQKWRLVRGDPDILQLIDFPRLLKSVYMRLDSMYYHSPNNGSGSTGVVALLFQNHIFVANAGDSRCVVSVGGAAKNLSLDHKPKHLGELMRIHNDGGYVAANRVNSILALSRAFGDYGFKEHNSRNRGKFALARAKPHVHLTPPEEFQVTAEPDVFIRRITREDEFLVIACDGVWDCYKPQTLVQVIRHELALGKKLTDVNELVLDNCIGMANTVTGIGFDNMTLIIVALHQRLINLDDWYTKIKNKILDEKFGPRGH